MALTKIQGGVVKNTTQLSINSINATGIITATTFFGNFTGTASTASFATTSFGLSGNPSISVTGINASGITTVSAGSTSAPSISPSGDSNTGIFFPSADTLAASTGGSGRLTIDSSGNINIDSGTVYVDAVNNRLGIGTSNPQSVLNISAASGGDTSGLRITRTDAGGGDWRIWSTATANGEGAGKLIFGNSANRVTIDGSGNVGIGTTSPTAALNVNAGGTDLTADFVGTSSPYIRIDNGTRKYIAQIIGSDFRVQDQTALQERIRIDSSGRLLVGTNSAQGDYTLQIQGDAVAATAAGCIYLRRGLPTSSIGGNVGADLGKIQFGANDGTVAARISCESDATWSSTSDCPGRLVFSTTADGASTPTERMRISQDGSISMTSKSIIIRDGDGSTTRTLELGSTYSGGGTSQSNILLATYGGLYGVRIRGSGNYDYSLGTNLSFATTNSASGVLTDRMIIDGSGRVTMPYQPVFKAYRSASTSGAGIIVFNNEIYDVGNNYNNSNGLFTAPVAGYYIFFVLTIGSGSSNTFVDVWGSVNGATTPSSFGARPTNQNNYSSAGSATNIVYLNANDTFGIYASGALYSDQNIWLQFGGYLLG